MKAVEVLPQAFVGAHRLPDLVGARARPGRVVDDEGVSGSSPSAGRVRASSTACRPGAASGARTSGRPGERRGCGRPVPHGWPSDRARTTGLPRERGRYEGYVGAAFAVLPVLRAPRLRRVRGHPVHQGEHTPRRSRAARAGGGRGARTGGPDGGTVIPSGGCRKDRGRSTGRAGRASTSSRHEARDVSARGSGTGDRRVPRGTLRVRHGHRAAVTASAVSADGVASGCAVTDHGSAPSPVRGVLRFSRALWTRLCHRGREHPAERVRNRCRRRGGPDGCGAYGQGREEAGSGLSGPRLSPGVGRHPNRPRRLRRRGRPSPVTASAPKGAACHSAISEHRPRCSSRSCSRRPLRDPARAAVQADAPRSGAPAAHNALGEATVVAPDTGTVPAWPPVVRPSTPPSPCPTSSPRPAGVCSWIPRPARPTWSIPGPTGWSG
ncbi:hypothetical protein SCANM63S_06536 [Streptomyces canarius]